MYLNNKRSRAMNLFPILFTAMDFLQSCGQNATQNVNLEDNTPQVSQELEGLSKAYLASGCFWCVEAIYESLEGVSEVVSGYAEGKESTARYLVSSGRTAHVEAVVVYYDSSIISYDKLIQVFFASGDPTTLNRQGPDRGYQYRSAIYYQNDKEKAVAESYKTALETSKVFSDPIVTDIIPFTTFFPAEEYHQDFERKNPNQGYVRAVSVPRLKRFQKAYPELLKKEAH
jgi:peptide-methionine (S)-S-oxide reductase